MYNSHVPNKFVYLYTLMLEESLKPSSLCLSFYFAWADAYNRTMCRCYPRPTTVHID
jgi:hypothetical protein